MGEAKRDVWLARRIQELVVNTNSTQVSPLHSTRHERREEYRGSQITAEEARRDADERRSNYVERYGDGCVSFLSSTFTDTSAIYRTG